MHVNIQPSFCVYWISGSGKNYSLLRMRELSTPPYATDRNWER